MGNRTRRGLSRGDRRRNERLRRLREAVPEEAAILGIDLSQAKQVAVVTGPGDQTLARRTFVCSPWGVDQVIDWGLEVAAREGVGPLVVACEPTGHRWKPVLERCRRRGLTLVCVQPLLVAREREREDLTRDRSDPKDATLIAHLARELRCYLPQVPEAGWARLRHLGARRAAKVRERGAARQSLRDLLECYWPAALEAAAKGLDSTTLLACLLVSTDPEEIRRMRLGTLLRRAARALPATGATRLDRRVVRRFHGAASDPRILPFEREGASERAAFALADLLHAARQVAECEDRMVGVLDALGYLELACSIRGLSPVGAAAILAETGDPTRYDSPRAWAKHAGACPRDNASGRFQGRTRVSGRGRPLLRTAAWRAAWPLVQHNPAFRARYQRLVGRERNPLNDAQARAAVAAALLRQLHAVLTRREAWDPEVAGGKGVVRAA
ncbi:MAG TPA: IS110 family transposase [Actinomycetota bacterium]|nr:IS110 family transposase [Actinomycetota bacterium]